MMIISQFLFVIPHTPKHPLHECPTIALNTYSYVCIPMGTQISLKLSDKTHASAKAYAEAHGFDNLQNFIRELIRERLFEKETEIFGGFSTYLASEESLARYWLSPEEDDAWAHLQRET